MGLVTKDDGWRIPDELWEEMKEFLPPRKPHPLGCHNPRVDDRAAMNAILFVARTGIQWGALDATGICNHSSAHRRFQEWTRAGVFEQFWIYGLLCYDRLHGIDWSFLSMDGAMTKAPLGGEKNRPKSHRPGQKGDQAQHRDRRQRDWLGSGRGRGQPQRLQAGARNSGEHSRPKTCAHS
jgi:transposase